MSNGDNAALELTEEEMLPVSPNAPKGIPIAKILKYASQGLSDQEVANCVGCSRPVVSIRLKPYRDAITALPDYQKRELDLIDLAKAGILEELLKRVYDPEVGLKKMAVPQLAMTFGILTDKAQAIKGKAPATASNLQVNINFDPGMLPQSDGSKHLEKIEDVIIVDMDGTLSGPNGAEIKGK